MEQTKINCLYDVIIATTTLPVTETDEESGYIYSIRFLRDFINIPTNRIQVDEFPQQALGEFLVSPCDLIASLSMEGICVKVSKDDAMLGSGSGIIPSIFLRQLTDPIFKVSHTMTIEMQKRNKPVATIEISIQFEKTNEDIDTRFLPVGCYDVCRPVDRSINPRDVIFTLGRSEKCPATTCITDNRLRSDPAPPFICPYVGDEKKKEKEECSCIVPGGQPPNERPDPRKKKAELKRLLRDLDMSVKPPTPPDHVLNKPQLCCQCRRVMNISSSGSLPTDFQFNIDGASGDGGGAGGDSHMRLVCGQSEPRRVDLCPVQSLPQLTQTNIKTREVCPLCCEDISWMPKLAACPYCGYKCLREVEEDLYDDEATAENLLRSHYRKKILKGSTEDDDIHTVCAKTKAVDDDCVSHCSCEEDTICSRCRIRKFCEQIFNVKKLEKLPSAPKPVPAEGGGGDAKAAKQIEIENSTESQRRLQLLKIFTEMRDSYEEKKNTINLQDQEDLRKKCQQFCDKARTKQEKRNAKRRMRKLTKELDKMHPIMKKKRHRKPPMPSKRYAFPKFQTNVMRFSHVACISESEDCGYKKIPKHMGWMWTKFELSRHKSWKPGAIMRPIRELMCYFLKDYPVDTVCLSRYHYPRTRRPAPPEPLVQHPTLHICRKNDVYVITLRPLKEPKDLAVAANPYADMKPVVFRITKNPMEVAKRSWKKELKKMGYNPCCCNRPVADCYCQTYIDKKMITATIARNSHESGWGDMTDSFVFSDTSGDESDAEYDFGVTPPAGIVKPERLKDTLMVNVDTQYCENDWAMYSMFPHPPSDLAQYCSCVVGERPDKFKFILGKGNVHEVKKPPKTINKKKGAKGKGKSKK